MLAGAGQVFVATSSGNPYHFNADTERLFSYAPDGRLVDSTAVSVAAHNMGLFGLALDGQDRLYVGDMNGRILRYRLRAGRPVDPTVYATDPMPGGWSVTMWNGLAFDPRGNLYVGDANGSIWRIPPDGQPKVWFRQIDVPLAGPYGITLGPDGKLYFDADPANRSGAMVVYRLPLVNHPTSTTLQEVHSFAPHCCHPNLPQGLAFDRAGSLYVSGLASGEIAVLRPDGSEQASIASPQFDAVNGLTFLGTSLLAANSDFNVVENPLHWTISRIEIGQPGYPPAKPAVP